MWRLATVVLVFLLMGIFVQASSAGVVETTLKLNFTIGSGDIVGVGENINPASGIWYSSNLTKRFMCAQNTSIGSKTVMVTVAAGSGFRNLNYTAGSRHNVQITEDYGEPFYIIFTDTNCTAPINNYPAIEKGRVSVSGTSPDVSVNGLRAWIPYARINFTQNLRVPPGTWDLSIKNNGTKKNMTQIEVTIA